MPQAKDVPRAEEATPDVGMATADEIENSDEEWTIEGVPKEDYGSDEDRCRDYLRAMKVVLKKGHNVAIEAMTRQREWHLIQAYIHEVCPWRFHSCFKEIY